jgi:hypothetical protein
LRIDESNDISVPIFSSSSPAKYKPKHHKKVREGAEKFPPPGIHVNVSELADSGYSRQSMDWHFFRSGCALQVLTGRVEDLAGSPASIPFPLWDRPISIEGVRVSAPWDKVGFR